MRHWIIANGYSLNQTPLHLLKNEITWGMNRIHLHYDKTDWRPSYYLIVGFNQQNEEGYWKDCIRAHWDTPKWLWSGFRNGDKLFDALGEGIGEVPNTTWIERCKKHHYYASDNYMKRAESWHLPELCTAFSGIGTVIQLAYLNGATEIYLVGADSDYSKNFFVADYANDPLDNENMTQVHRVASRSCPIPIYNCTIGGMLDVYPRRDLMEVLNG